MTHENVKDERERERLNVREKDVIEKARELEERGSGAYHLYDKSQANACTAICILPGVFMRWISFFARAISFFDRGGGYHFISFFARGILYLSCIIILYHFCIIISISLFYIILKHSIKRYEEICVRIIASTAFHVKCLFITLVWMQQFRCF